MALFITTSQLVAYSITGDVFLLEGVTIRSDFDSTIDEVGGVNASFLRIDGTVLCSGSTAVALTASSGSPSDTIVIGATGAVHGTVVDNGIEMVGAFQRIINDGQVSGRNGIGIDSMLFGSITNGGTVTGIDSAAISAVFSNSVTITNSGTIRGESGIELFESYASILNTGSIVATDAGGFGISAGAGIGANVIRNTGRIEAPQTAINGSASSETITNTGDILGDVLLGGSNDTFRGRHGFVQGEIYGGLGSDFIASGSGDDVARGDDGNDTLRGWAGDDTLYGGRDDDVLRGDAGDDILYGGTGRDDFVFARRTEDDRIADFQNGLDQIDVSAFNLANFAALSGLAQNRAGGLLLDLTGIGGGTVLVAGMTLALFDAADAIL
ncbi:MAG: calcium-binding protein [Gemmobacter sp.]